MTKIVLKGDYFELLPMEPNVSMLTFSRELKQIYKFAIESTMTTLEVAAYLGVTKKVLDNLATRHGGPLFNTIKGKRVYRQVDVDRWLAANPWIKVPAAKRSGSYNFRKANP
jgi:hypothetical protein